MSSHSIDMYRGLYVPPDMLDALLNRPAEVDAVCNGVGSDVGLLGKVTYHIIPATIWFLDVTRAADIHDWMYSMPINAKIAYKDEADRVFLNNMLRLIDMDDGWWGRRLAGLRRDRAKLYYEAVRDFGGPSFWAGKNVKASIAYDISTTRAA